MNSTFKGRYWAFLVYPEDFPSFLDEARESFLPLVISPLHDQDGVKPHWHVLICYEGAMKMSTVLGDVHRWNVDYVEKIRSRKAYINYMSHEGTDKFKYDENDIIYLTGDDESSSLSHELIEICCTTEFVNFRDLAITLLEMKRYDLLAELKSSSYFYSHLI